MLLVRSKIEAGFGIFLDSLVTSHILAHSRGRLWHTADWLNAECRLLSADFRLASVWHCGARHKPLYETPAQHRPGVFDDLLEVNKGLHSTSWKQLLLDCLLHCAPHAHSGFERQPFQSLQRCLPNATRGR